MNRDFGEWPLNEGWPLNRWPLNRWPLNRWPLNRGRTVVMSPDFIITGWKAVFKVGCSKVRS